jgi:tetratricopeptide (TPR) repeat protein
MRRRVSVKGYPPPPTVDLHQSQIMQKYPKQGRWKFRFSPDLPWRGVEITTAFCWIVCASELQAVPMAWHDKPLVPGEDTMTRIDSPEAAPKIDLPADSELLARSKEYLKMMRDDLSEGRLDRLGVIAPALVRLQPDHHEYRDLYCLYLAASGDIEKARKERAGKGMSASSEPWGDCSDALVFLKSGSIADATKSARQATQLGANHPYPWSVLGRILMESGNLEEAEKSFVFAIGKNPKFLPGHINLGALMLLKSEPRAALVHFRRALELAPCDMRASHGSALALTACGDLIGAIEAYRAILLRSPRNGEALLALGNLQLQAGKFEDAKQTGERIIGIGLAEGDLFMAQVALHAGDAKQACEILDRLPPDSARFTMLRVNCLITSGNLESALDAIDEIMKREPRGFGPLVARVAVLQLLGRNEELPDNEPGKQEASQAKLLHFLQGVDLGRRGEWDKAFNAFEASENVVEGFSVKGLERMPGHGAVTPEEMPLLGIGLLMHVQGLREIAADFYSKAIERNCNSAMGNYLLASTLVEKKDMEGAMKSLQAVLVKSPDFFPALYLIGELHMRAGAAMFAEEYLKRANAVVPTPMIDFKLGVIAENTGRLDEAEAFYKSFLGTEKGFYAAYNQLAWLYARRSKNLDIAMELATKANELQPGNASVLDTIGWIHFKQGRSVDALNSLEASCKINPKDMGASYHLGAVRLALGRVAEAKPLLEEVCRLGGESQDAVDARKLLESVKP